MPIILGAQADYRSCELSRPSGVSGLVEERSVRAEARARALVELTEVTLPAQVAIKQVRTLLAESLRFPEEGQSAQG